MIVDIPSFIIYLTVSCEDTFNLDLRSAPYCSEIFFRCIQYVKRDNFNNSLRYRMFTIWASLSINLDLKSVPYCRKKIFKQIYKTSQLIRASHRACLRQLRTYRRGIIHSDSRNILVSVQRIVIRSRVSCITAHM